MKRAFALVMGLTIALATEFPASVARAHRDRVPSTGLAGIAFDRLPPDVSFDTGDGTRPLHTRFGKPLVLNFWGSWCGPCLAELGQFAAARERFGDRVGIVTISYLEKSDVGAGILSQRGLAVPDVDDPAKRLARAFGVSAVPVTLVLRADGTVAHVSVGELDPGELAASLEPLIGGPAAADAAPSAPPSPVSPRRP